MMRTTMRESGKYKLLEAERKRERHQNPASSPTNLSGGNYHHLPVLDIVLKNIKNQYPGAKPSGACSLGIAGIRALSEGNYHHLPVLDIVLKNIKNQYLWRCVVWHMPFMHRGHLSNIIRD